MELLNLESILGETGVCVFGCVCRYVCVFVWMRMCVLNVFKCVKV